MFENQGLGAVLSFESGTAVANMGKAERGFNGVTAATKKTGSAGKNVTGTFQQMERAMSGTYMKATMLGMGMGMLGASMTAIGSPALFGMKSAMGFEFALSGVAAVAQATRAELNKLRETSLGLSLQTQYMGTDVAQSMEVVARAGFTANETMQAMPGILAAAAAEQMPVAQAADIIAITLKSMGDAAFGAQKTLAARTNHIADALAVMSAKTVTSIAGLGEAFTYTAGQARVSGLSFDETAAGLGVLADMGQRGSMAGMQWQQMLIRLASPTPKAIALFKKMGMGQADLNIETLGLGGVFDKLRVGMEKLSPIQQKQALNTLFSTRGQRAAGAMIFSTKGRYEELYAASHKANGESKEMADVRLKNLTGAFILAKSSVQAFWSVLFNAGEQSGVALLIGKTIDKVNSLVFAMMAINSGVADPLGALKKNLTSAGSIGNLMAGVKSGMEGYFDPEKALSFARGIYDGFRWVKDGIVQLGESAKSFLSALGLGGVEGGRQFAKMATAAVLLSAALGPVVIALSGLVLAAGGLALVGGHLRGLFSGIGAAAGWMGRRAGLMPALAAAAAVVPEVAAPAAAAAYSWSAALQPIAAAPVIAPAAAGAVAGGGFLARMVAPFAGLGPALAPVGLALAVVAGGFLLLRKHGESAGETLSRLAGSVMGFFGKIPAMFGRVTDAVAPLFKGILAAVEPLGMVFQQVLGVVLDLAGALLKPAFWIFVGILSAVSKVVGEVLGGMGDLLKSFTDVGDYIGKTLSPSFVGMKGDIDPTTASLVSMKTAVDPDLSDPVTKLLGIFKEWSQVSFSGVNSDLSSMSETIDQINKRKADRRQDFMALSGLKSNVLWQFLEGMRAIERNAPQLNAALAKIGLALVGPIQKAAGALADMFQWLSDFSRDHGGDVFLGALGLGNARRVSGWVGGLNAIAGRNVMGEPSVMGTETFLGTLGTGPTTFDAPMPRFPMEMPGPRNLFVGPMSAPSLMSEAVNDWPLAKNRVTPEQLRMSEASRAVLLGNQAERETRRTEAAAWMAMAERPVQVNSTVELNHTSEMNMDGDKMGEAMERRKLELSDRAGANTTPWQRRQLVVVR